MHRSTAMAYYKQFGSVFILSCVLAVHCQEFLGGSEYVFAIPMTYNIGSSKPPRVLITTFLLDPVFTSLTIPGLAFEVNTTITKDEYAYISIPYAALVQGPGKHDKTVIVKSSDAVTIHCFDNESNELDGFVVLPTSHLGTEYYVVSYVPYDPSYPSFFTMSALGHDTSVHFTTKAGQEYVVTLLPYETYRFDGSSGEDLTGTHIHSSRPLSTINGICAEVPDNVGYRDGLLVNIPPVERWGHQFVMAPFMTKTCGYVYRVLSANQTTTLTISNVGTVKLQAREHYERDVTAETITEIASDFPVLVVQYMKGYSACDDRGDPSMIVVQPTESYYNNVTFPVFDTTYHGTYYYFINVITKCSHVDGLIFDDTTPMAGWDQLTTDDQSMCCVRGKVLDGLHRVGNSDPLAEFTVSVYMMCIGCSTSYAYQAGIASAVQIQPPTPPEPTEAPPIDILPVSAINGLELYCSGTNMTALLNTSVLPFNSARDIQMRDPNCFASAYGIDQAIITTDYHECQTFVEESDGHIIFRNALILNTGNLAIPIKPPQVEIECRVERHHLAEASFTSTLNKHVSFGNFTYDLDIFHDKTYSTPYEPEDYPIDVKFGDNLYLATSVTTVNDLELLVDSCWGTPSTDPWHDTSYSLIHDGCPDDESVTFFDSGDPSIQQFTFKAFAFKGDSWLVFIHCQLLVCNADTPNSRCAQGCVDQSAINSQRKRRSNYDLHTITSRPLVVRG